MSQPIDLSGQRFGRLTAQSRATGARKSSWVCLCDCGTTITTRSDGLRSGHAKSCGCLHRDTAKAQGKKNRTHGHSIGSHTRTYRGWAAMMRRCTNPNATNWRFYGGRGIKVCERWHSFENFLADMGEHPDGYTIERINNDGAYTPGNCRWATPVEQAANRRPKETPK